MAVVQTRCPEWTWRELVGAPRFELGTPCAQGRCATRLRYAPTCCDRIRGRGVRLNTGAEEAIDATRRREPTGRYRDSVCRNPGPIHDSNWREARVVPIVPAPSA